MDILKRKKCLYCGKDIIDSSRPDNDKDYSRAYKSSEHIIQNAVGGKLESVNICCDRCNVHIEELVDKDFCKTFVPVTNSISNFAKSRKSNAPAYSGYAYNSYLGEESIYSASIIKGNSVKNSNELIEKLKKEGTNDLNQKKKKIMDESVVLFSDFKIDNKSFKYGFSKIALNFATYSNVQDNILKNVFDVTMDDKTGEMKDIYFKTRLIPFVALNDFDQQIEFSPINDDYPLTHELVLFENNGDLFCYISLFDTFQWYVLLYENPEKTEVCTNECKIVNSYIEYIGDKKNTDLDFFPSDDRSALAKKNELYSVKKSLLVTNKIIKDFYLKNNEYGSLQNKHHIICASTSPEKKRLFGLFYPYIIMIIQNDIYSPQHGMIRDYTVKKFMRLSNFLISNKMRIDDEIINSLSKSDRSRFFGMYKQSMRANRVTKIIDLNELFKDSQTMYTMEQVVEIFKAKWRDIFALYDGNVEIQIIDRKIGSEQVDADINRTVHKWLENKYKNFID